MFLFADATTTGMLVATIVLVVLTGFYVAFTYQIVRAQTDPCVIVYVQQNEVWPTLLEIVIENVGRGLARDVEFELSEPIPHCVSDPNLQGKAMDSGPFVNGVPALAPGGKRKILWGNYPDVERIVGDRHLRVTCRFRRASSDFFATKIEATDCLLEYASFRDSLALSTVHELLKRLERVAKNIEHLRPYSGSAREE